METETLKLGGGIYTVPEIALILGIPKHKVDYWVNAYLKDKFQKQQSYQYHSDFGRQSVVNFYSLIETYTFFHLKAGGATTKQIIEAHDALSKHYRTVYPFAHASILQSGGEILFGEKVGNKEISIARADRSFQLYFTDVIRPFCKKIVFGKDDLAERYYPMGPDKTVIIDPHHQFGQPTVEGTNILVSTINDLHQAGDSKRLIKNLYNLSDRQINDAIDYFQRAA
ncbi:MAG: DUF433 domain-containing protein [Flavobacteriales bacterium]|nr:DUF433 domain-containing protein [Flavobacteriales bacterium]